MTMPSSTKASWMAIVVSILVAGASLAKSFFDKPDTAEVEKLIDTKIEAIRLDKDEVKDMIDERLKAVEIELQYLKGGIQDTKTGIDRINDKLDNLDRSLP